ncbi:alpha-glucan family phosphorylase [Acidithiobacillus sp. IBUN Pt1247-S3]|uniref:alpha-glucan family phosphorylase n=1 Tax=Acidithiobacillus sp. IBUN Pt1247-S3 TaxID=3166642 RepID=UPI0034E60D12
MKITPSYVLPQMPEALDGLTELALDLRWSWSYRSDALWERLDGSLWERTRNPWLLLQNLEANKLEKLAHDHEFLALLQEHLQRHRQESRSQHWFQKNVSSSLLQRVAYFSMEFGLSEALPIYSGGLGILAGDVLKTASDLGVPMVGIGILWQQGYFRQNLDDCGRQLELYPYNDPTQLPVVPVRDEEGQWLRLELSFPGRQVILRAWQAQVGEVPLYLLDSNDPLNSPADRGITAELYGGGPEMRLQQEICLGVGGWLLLRHLGMEVDVCHLNEGHAAFAILARIYSHMQDHGSDFQCALNATRAGNVFTTHTPVAAGFDRFAPELLARYVEGAPEVFGVDLQHILGLGRADAEDPHEPFNMAWLAIHGSIQVNGVSALHGAVSRQLFQPLFPRWPTDEVPVSAITNGVHVPSWDNAEADALWTKHCGAPRWLEDLQEISAHFRGVSDAEIWQLRGQGRQHLIDFARHRLQRQLAMAHRPQEEIDAAALVLDPNTLTIGFARRFTAYKRPNLLLSDPERLYRILSDPRHPVQLLIAGKAHPRDGDGKAMIQEWTQFLRRHPDIFHNVVFIADYDMLVAAQLVQGVDVWLNTPRRPWEASGTSGMKVLVNGGLNFSELDGWWAEAYSSEVGWALGDRHEHNADPAWDRQEAEHLYQTIEQEIAPLFYQGRDDSGCPCDWVAKIRASMAELTPQFSSHRMLQEYVEKLYLPAAKLLRERSSQKQLQGICAWQNHLRAHWHGLRFGELHCEDSGAEFQFQMHVYLDDIPPEMVQVELFANGIESSAPELHPMQRSESLAGAVNGFTYRCNLAKRRPVSDYTPRVVARHPLCRVPLENNAILWYR